MLQFSVCYIVSFEHHFLQHIFSRENHPLGIIRVATMRVAIVILALVSSCVAESFVYGYGARSKGKKLKIGGGDGGGGGGSILKKIKPVDGYLDFYPPFPKRCPGYLCGDGYKDG